MDGLHTSGNRELIPPRKEAGPPWTSLVHDWMGLIQRSCSLLSPLGWVVRTILRTRSQHHPPAGCHVVQKGAPKANLGVARRGGRPPAHHSLSPVCGVPEAEDENKIHLPLVPWAVGSQCPEESDILHPDYQAASEAALRGPWQAPPGARIYREEGNDFLRVGEESGPLPLPVPPRLTVQPGEDVRRRQSRS